MCNESIVEDGALAWFGELGYSCLGAEALTPSLSHGEREPYGEVVLVGRLRGAARRLNPATASRTLAILRATPLPELLSVELSVPNLRN